MLFINMDVALTLFSLSDYSTGGCCNLVLSNLKGKSYVIGVSTGEYATAVT